MSTPTAGIRRLTAAGLVALFCVLAFAPHAHATDPGDVYYTAHVVQKFKYGPLGGNVLEWTNETFADTVLAQTAEHDTSTAISVVSIATSIQAGGGVFHADLDAEITADARVGIYHQAFNDLDIEIYVRGPTGTAYGALLGIGGTLEASREGGLPGTLQSVNGTSAADFEGTTLTVANGGTESLPIAFADTLSGVTTTEILVNNEVYSLACSFVITSNASVTQAACILGCMTQAAHFHALSSGDITINTYLGGLPTAVPGFRSTPALLLGASPNPLNASTVVSFQAPAGTQTTVEVFDVRGSRVATLFQALATGDVQSLPWNASSLPSGVYFLRARSEAVSSSKKLLLLK